jgi:hypothetical protein
MDFFKNNYDPSLKDIQKTFPDFKYTTKEEWIKLFEDLNLDSKEYVKFALKKMENVTTSYRLSDHQKIKLQSLIFDVCVDGNKDWEAYCNILTPRQIGYIGV